MVVVSVRVAERGSFYSEASTVNKVLPPATKPWDLTLPVLRPSEPIGEKKEERQQTHMTSAIVNMPSLPGLFDPLESVDLLSRTKLTSELFSPSFLEFKAR